ncbi:hypothetical protein [Aestuariivirga sp.]|uniref:hypothetical protein n=1 Tax=Aestuariivirga sp. TaxID=2650926 RepID=UPI0025C2F233|nr:hypothetical protein [Aestuariivirga sp.]MCA3555435.1 hypothetical protein [Aestuariivirga sp.]
MYVRLLALNALFLAIYAFRRVSGARPMPVASALFVQLAAVAASIVVLYQREVQNYLISLMDRL